MLVFDLSLRLIQKCDLLGKFSFFCPFVDISSLSLTYGKQIHLKSILFFQVHIKDKEMKFKCVYVFRNSSLEMFWKICYPYNFGEFLGKHLWRRHFSVEC